MSKKPSASWVRKADVEEKEERREAKREAEKVLRNLLVIAQKVRVQFKKIDFAIDALVALDYDEDKGYAIELAHESVVQEFKDFVNEVKEGSRS